MQRGERVQVVHAEQAPVGDQHHPLERVARQQRGDHRQQSLGLGRVARVNLVRDGQALGGLHQREHELPLDQTRLATPEGTHIAVLHRLPSGLHRGQVVEHHRQVLVDERAHQAGQPLAQGLAVLVDHVHGAQQVLVRGQAVGKAEIGGQRHGVEPAQHAQLAARIAQPVQHHGAQAGQHIELDPGPPPGAGQVIKAQGAPQTAQRPDVARAAAVDEAQVVERVDGWSRSGGSLLALRTLQRGNQGVHITAGLKAPERADGALARLALLIAERLDQLRVAARTGLGDLYKHGRKCSPNWRNT